MKILFYIREDYLKNMAGDTIQFLKTKEYMEKLGVDITISSNPKENLEKYNLIHLFNTIRVKDTYGFFNNARKYKKKTLLTPIFWNYIDYIPKGKCSDLEMIYWNEGNKLRKEIFQNVDMILPSAEVEMKEILQRFHTTKPYRVVPNGVDEKFANVSKEEVLAEYKLGDFVLCVGRVCQHKNQLSLAKVTNELKVPLVLVGPVNDLKYYHKCIREKPDIIYLPKVQHLQLASIYKAAKVHALASWYEIPGLVNLEAALAGCNIVTSREGSTKEYFKDYVEYIDPYNLDDIGKSLKKSLEKEKTEELSTYIRENYLWEKVAEKLLHVYEEVLNQKDSSN